MVTSPRIEPLTLIYKFNNALVARAVDGVSDAQLWERPTGGSPLGWILGHITNSRQQLLTLLGASWDSGLGPHFKRGAVLQDPSAYPARDAIEGAWKATHPKMRDAFAAVTDERLDAAPAGISITGTKTVADVAAFLALHESYHVGQMSLIRRALGLSGVADM